MLETFDGKEVERVGLLTETGAVVQQRVGGEMWGWIWRGSDNGASPAFQGGQHSDCKQQG